MSDYIGVRNTFNLCVEREKENVRKEMDEFKIEGVETGRFYGANANIEELGGKEMGEGLWSPDTVGEYHLGDLMYNLEKVKGRGNKMSEESKKFEFYVAGVQHHDIYKVTDRMKEGDFLSMVLEPSNKYDPNAVRLELYDIMIGYVPRKISADITALIITDEGLWCCKIVELKWDEKQWKQVKVSIEEVNWEQADCSSEVIEKALEQGDYFVEEVGVPHLNKLLEED